MPREMESPSAARSDSSVTNWRMMRRRSPGATSCLSTMHAKTVLHEEDLLSGNLFKNYVVELAKENSEMIKTIIDLQREREVLKTRLVAANAMKASIISHNGIERATVDAVASGWNFTHATALTNNLLKKIQDAVERKINVSGHTYNSMQVVFQSMEKQVGDAVVFDRDKKLQKQLTGLSQSISRSWGGDSPNEGRAAEEPFMLMHRVVAPATECVDQFVGLCIDLLLALYKAYARHH